MIANVLRFFISLICFVLASGCIFYFKNLAAKLG
jgi:hypothetical protein